MTSLPGYPCSTCKRQSQGFAMHFPHSVNGRDFHQFCSIECAGKFMKHNPLTNDEKKAIEIGGQHGGAYLDSISKFDLRQLTPEQWAEFCGKIFHGTCAELERMADDEIPF